MDLWLVVPARGQLRQLLNVRNLFWFTSREIYVATGSYEFLIKCTNANSITDDQHRITSVNKTSTSAYWFNGIWNSWSSGSRHAFCSRWFQNWHNCHDAQPHAHGKSGAVCFSSIRLLSAFSFMNYLSLCKSFMMHYISNVRQFCVIYSCRCIFLSFFLYVYACV